MRPFGVLLVGLVLSGTLGARPVAVTAAPERIAPGRIAANRNVRPAGTLRGGVLTLHLEARAGRWYPEADDGLGIDVQAFGERGRALEIPGPLVRVPAGTEVRATVRNALDSTLVLRGLHARPTGAADTLQVAPGATREVRFRLDVVGTYAYWGRTRGDTSEIGLEGIDSQLNGAIVVDPAGAPPPRDRVLVLGVWSAERDTSGARRGARGGAWGEALVINGKAWPHNERLTHEVGDSVRWRVINASGRVHPMHLHGFYFRVDSRGTWARDTVYAEAQRRLGVTEFMLRRSTMAVTWVPERPGNWIFHCHFAAHVASDSRLYPASYTGVPVPGGVEHAAHSGPAGHGAHPMAGLVLGLHVRERAGGPAPAQVVAGAEPRALRLLVQEQPRRFGDEPAIGYVLQGDGPAPRADSVSIPGPMLLLTRGEPVRITVHNRTPRPTAVHWHGLEIESFPDGVPGWSGTPGRLMPPIAPGDSFVAAFTPPRSGTFMYHAHMDEGLQIGSGAYGPLLVVEPGERYDAAVDRVLMFSQDGPGGRGTRPTLNGRAVPDTLELRADVAQRLRFLMMPANGAARLRLRRAAPGDSALATWRLVAKDGATAPAAQATPRPAALLIATGETYDVEVAPPAGAYALELGTPTRVFFRVPVRVR